MQDRNNSSGSHQGDCLEGQTETTISQLLANVGGCAQKRGMLGSSLQSIAMVLAIGLAQFEASATCNNVVKGESTISAPQAYMLQVEIMKGFGSGKAGYEKPAMEIFDFWAKTLESDYTVTQQIEGLALPALAVEFVAQFFKAESKKFETGTVNGIDQPRADLTPKMAARLERAAALLLAEAAAKQTLFTVPGPARRSVWALVYSAFLLQANLLNPALNLLEVEQFISKVEECVRNSYPAADTQATRDVIALCDGLGEFGLDKKKVMESVQMLVAKYHFDRETSPETSAFFAVDLSNVYALVGIQKVITLVTDLRANSRAHVRVGGPLATVLAEPQPQGTGPRMSPRAQNGHRSTAPAAV